ncbi:MAG: basic helix-loop-helix domain-containing protein, partial [Gaiellaceae bacterium]
MSNAPQDNISDKSNTAEEVQGSRHYKNHSNPEFTGREFTAEVPDTGITGRPPQARRMSRNRREQERAQKIAQQIKELQRILHASRVAFEPNKFSTLKCVVDYISRLQNHCQRLDDEKKRLVETIQATNEILSSSHVPTSNAPTNQPREDDTIGDVPIGNTDVNQNSADILRVQDIDFRNIFNRCGAALA